MRFPSRLFAIAAILTIYVTASYAQSKTQDAAAIRYARNISVSRIEKGMPLIRFDPWFRSLVRKGMKVTYEVNDCGEQTGTSADRGRDFPMCVEARAGNEVVGVRINFQIGTFKTGITMSRPVTRGINVDEEGEETTDLNSLAELVKFLKEAWGT
ncbi:MAG TPA: hypothetical protein VHQ01_13075 [Pyrinomonadaceae bacterium]|nr:hypothetical protein [Pyrinomonadaceae bacterium]